MFRVSTLPAVLSLALLMTTSAYANDKEGVYATVGATLLSTELDLTSTDIADQVVDLGTEDADITMLTGRLGYRFNDFFAVEGEAGFGLGGDSFDRVVPVTVLGSNLDVDTNVDLDVESYYIAFARGIFPVSEEFDLFARVGYGRANAEAEVNASVAGLSATASAEDDADGFAYGIGGQYNFTQKDGVRLDYTRLDETDIISLAYARRF